MPERVARLVLLAIVLGVPAIVLIARWTGLSEGARYAIEIHGRMSEDGGWTPSELTVDVGEPLHLRLTSDDVVHGFAVGRRDEPAVDVEPGKFSETTLIFSEPGKYVYYCTRWCGPDHWRMRGVIEVSGSTSDPVQSAPALYLALGLDLDAPRLADVVPAGSPSAERGARLGVTLPDEYLTRDHYRTHSPLEIWQALRANPAIDDLTAAEIWDLVAWIWELNTTPDALARGRKLYTSNCAACHGENGEGDGVMADKVQGDSLAALGHGTTRPADFTDPERMLDASPALLQGKIVRGGMGTGMPYWGPIFTEAQTWAIVDYLWSFQFPQFGHGDEYGGRR